MSFFVRATTLEDWKRCLTDPCKQWKNGRSAKSLAYCWMEARGFPSSVKSVFQKSEFSAFKGIAFIAGFVEYKVSLPGSGHASQNDIFVLAKRNNDLVAATVEGKVDESFGETVGDWLREKSEGGNKRLRFLSKTLQVSDDGLREIRYQLLHRTVSAVMGAKRFNASTALMLVHSFHPKHVGFDDYSKFASLFGIKAQLNTLHFAKRVGNVNLYLAWISEDEYLTK